MTITICKTVVLWWQMKPGVVAMVLWTVVSMAPHINSESAE